VAYSGVVKDVRRAVALETPDEMPVFACSEEFDVKWHGRCTYEEVCQSGALIADVWAAAIEVLMRGSPAEVERETERIMSIGCSGGGYLFNTGEMNPRDVPPENMKAMIRAARAAAH